MNFCCLSILLWPPEQTEAPLLGDVLMDALFQMEGKPLLGSFICESRPTTPNAELPEGSVGGDTVGSNDRHSNTQ